MRKVLCLLFVLVSSAHAASKIEVAVQELTQETILVRVGLTQKCPVSTGLLPFAGAQLEQFYADTLTGLRDSDLTVAAWKKATKSDCTNDCSCSALSKIYEKYPAAAKKKISSAKIEKALARMTDADYSRCMERLPKFCELPKVREFLETLRKNEPISEDAP